MSRTPCAVAYAFLGLLAITAGAQTPPPDLAKPPAGAETWSIVSGGSGHGQEAHWTSADGARWSRMSLNLRGFVTEIDQQVRFAPDHAIASLAVRGTVPEGDAAESYRAEGGRFMFKSPVDQGGGKTDPRLFYLPFGGTLDAFSVLVEALLKAPDRTLDLAPSGRAHLERLASADVSNGREKKTLTAYAITGLALSPQTIWLEGERTFGTAGFLSYLPTGWESVASTLIKAQDDALAQRAPALFARIAKLPAGLLAFRNARLYDADARRFLDAMTVVVGNGRITAVGPTATTPIPGSAQVIDGTGKTLTPGLWDSHQHYVDDAAGPLLLAQGITSVRDPGNLPTELMARKRRIEAGELLGTRIVPSLLIDGPGPYAAQVGVIVHSLEEALAAVRRAKADGFFAIKLYGSLDPAYVGPMAQEAHRLGLRVHGHIPAGMRPLDAVRAGYDEITHINFVLMQVMPDEVIRQSNTMLRFVGPGRFGADVDLKSREMQGYLDELASRHIAVDPTLVTFENIFVPDRGVIAPSDAPYAASLPPQVTRAFLSGGLQPPADLSRTVMRASFAKLEALIPELSGRHIPVLAGTDGAGFELVRELELYVAAGLTPEDALATATIVPAQIYHLDDQTGSIAVGKLAELALIDGDPGRTIGDLRQVVLVMRDGRLMEADDLRAAAGISARPLPAASPRRREFRISR